MSDQGYPGAPQWGQPYGDPRYQDADYGHPQYAHPQYGEPQYGRPQYGEPQYGYGPPPPYAPGAPPPTQPRRNRSSLWIALAVVVLAGLGVGAFFLFAGNDTAGTGSPKQTASRLFDAGRSGDLAAARKVLCRGDNAVGQAERLNAGGKVTAYRITGVQQGGSSATVQAEVTTAGRGEQPVTLPMVKESGAWKVCFSSAGSRLPTGSSSISSSAPVNPAPLPSISLPSTLPSLGALGNPCSFASSASQAATIFVGLAEIGQSDTAQGCVYQDTVPKSTVAGVATGSGTGKLYVPPSNGGGPVFEFHSVDGTTTLRITVTKEPDGRYYVTNVEKS